MKRITIIFSAIILSIGAAFAQPVSDHGVIPVGVTLNSILRLNITSGGNIEFVVTTIDQYNNGIVNADRYDTRFTVASSVDFDVTLTSDRSALQGVDNPTHTLDLNNIGFEITSAGTGAVGTNWNFPDVHVLDPTPSPVSVIESINGQGAGSAEQNSFIINWELGTGAQTGMNGNSLLQQSVPGDRYVTNVLVDLVAQ